jgi:hypothetical protein
MRRWFKEPLYPSRRIRLWAALFLFVVACTCIPSNLFKDGFYGPSVLIGFWKTLTGTIGVGLAPEELPILAFWLGLAGAYLLLSLALGWLIAQLFAIGSAIRRIIKAQ